MADQHTMVELLRAPTEGLEKDNPHDHIRWFNKITSTIKYKDVLNSAIKLMLFPFSLARAVCRWLEKEPLRSIHTWEDLFDESFHEAWDRYKDLLRVCPHHGFTKLHRLDTFYNALNPSDQDSLNAAAGGNLLEKRTQDVLKIVENKSKVRNSRSKSIISQVKACDVNSNSSLEIAKLTHAVNQQTSAVTTAMMAILKQFQATPHPASVKAVEETYVTCGAAVNYNQGNPGFRPIGSGSLPRNTVANPKGELKSITTHSGLVIDGPTVPTPHQSINPKKMLKALMSNKEKLEELANTPLNENCSATAHALIDVHGEEMILCDGDERLILNMRYDTSSYSNQPQRESINLINVFNNLNLDSTKDLHPHLHEDPLSSNITFSSNLLPEEFANELTFPLKYDDDLQFDIESDLKEIEFLLYQDVDSSLTASIDFANPADNDFSKVDALPSTNNEDKIFNLGILIQEKTFEIITRVVQDKKLATYNASSMLEDFDPPFYEPLFFKDVPKMLLLFSSENVENVFKPGVHTSKKGHSSIIPKLSHPGYKIFKINQIFKSSMKIFLFFYGKDTHLSPLLPH
nr:hypothetical protein [Tanacetum cinerariifolium]